MAVEQSNSWPQQVMESAVLEVRNMSHRLENGAYIFTDISFTVNEGDILVLQGKSGSGKSTLLKCIAHLVLHSGDCLYRGYVPQGYGITSFRTKVLYVPQRPSLLPGSPTDFLETITSLATHKAKGSSFQYVLNRAFQTGEKWGIDNELWARAWSNLSGGEGQRILLASAVALDTAEILLLDEPTSALDPETSSWVETYLVERIRQGDTSLKALIWITHSSEQGRRVGTRFIHMSAGGCYESDDPAPTPNTPSSPHESRSKASSIRLTIP